MKDDRPFYVLLVLGALLNMGPGLLIPLMPVLLTEYGFSTGGLSIAFFAILFARFVAQRFGGRWVARFGARNVLLCGFVLYIVTMVAYPFLMFREGFIALRFLEGIFEGLAVVSINDLAVALSDKERRGKQMGMFGASFGLGIILGPVTGGLLYGKLGMSAVFWGTAVVATAGLVLLLAYRHRLVSARPEPAKTAGPDKQAGARGFRALLGGGNLGLLVYYQPYILRRVLYFSLQMILPLHLHEVFHVPPESVGLYFALSAVLTTTLMPFAGRVADRVAEPRRLLTAMLLTMGAGIGALGLVESLALFVVFFVVETLAFCFMLPTAMKVFSDLVAEHPRRPEILGSFGSLVDLASLATPLVVVPLFSVNPAAAWGLLGGLCFVAAAPFALRSAASGAIASEAP